MIFNTLLISALVASTVAYPVYPRDCSEPENNDGGAEPILVNGLTFSQLDALAPAFGFESGVNPGGTGDCDGAVLGNDGKPVSIPCDCPPDRTQFINVSFLNFTFVFGREGQWSALLDWIAGLNFGGRSPGH